MPRPVKEDPRDCFKTFRFTAAEVTRLESRAHARGQTLSSYVRATMLGRDALDGPESTLSSAASTARRSRSRSFHSSPAEATYRILIDQVRRVGTNLNQITHRMNELRIPPPRELTLVLDEIRRLVRKAREP